MTRLKILDLACVAVLCAILTAGLWPFHAPRNAVTWLANENGLHFGNYGTILTTESFRMPGPQDGASSSLEIWLQPELASGSHTLLSFSTPKNPLQFSLHQYFSYLILEREIQGDERRAAKIGLKGVFRQIRPIFVTITSGPQQTAMYVDGAVAGTFPQFRLDKDFAGQLVIGTSPVANDIWPGDLRGLAIYHRELTAAQVLRHYETWTTRGRPELLGDEGVVALYLFDEHAGTVAHNAVRPGIDLQIPNRYLLLRQWLLKPFWKEYKPGWEYWKDTLMNIAGFVPLGFFFFAYLSSVRRIRRAVLVTVALGFAVSLTIELSQSYIPTRHSGMTDLLTNTLGTFLGVKLHTPNAIRAWLTKLY
jgi:VanZ family protein